MEIIKDLISSFLGDRLTKILESGTDRIADEISQMANNRILEYLVAEYDTNNKTKNLLHKSEPIELEKFYQPLFLRRAPKNLFAGLRSILNNTIRINTKHLKSLFNPDKNCIAIIGTAGSGKSTMVKYLFVDSIRTNFKIPIKIELRYLNNYDQDLLSYISEEIIKFNKIAEKDYIIEKLLNSGKFVFFFDGYDEIISNKKGEITRQISKITKRYNKNNYILTSRPFVNVEMLDNFHNYEICDLELDEVNAFIRKQFDVSQQEYAENIIKAIEKKHNNDAYKSFLTNPLLLSMFILTCEKDTYIPDKRSEYYWKVFNTLFSGHDTIAKFGYDREKLSGLKKDDFINLLEHFSAKSFFEQKYYFSEQYFEEEMQKCKDKLGLEFDTGYLLDDLKVAIGVLIEEGLEITYSHKSLQEYFAALFATSLAYENKLQFYNYLYGLFTRIYFLNFDFVNFFSLLCEMDKIDFQKNFSIPIIKYIKENVNNPSLPMEETGLLFLKAKSIASVIFPKIQPELDEIYYKYKEKTAFLQIKISSRNSDFINKVYPIFKSKVADSFRKIDFDGVISDIENDIMQTKNRNSEFIDGFTSW